MVVIDMVTEINSVIKEIFNFLQSDESVKEDFYEYLSTIGARNISLNQMEKVFLPYIFERNLNGKSILEIFAETNKKNIEITQALINTISSVFEIKRLLKNGFELYNVINEKTYTVRSLTKMSSFRGIYAGQYIVARIFNFKDNYFVVEISSILSHSQQEEATRYAVMKLIQNPSLLYLDNPEKEAEIVSIISKMYEKFIKAFGKNIIYTTNKHADDIIGTFNENETVDLSGKGSEMIEHKFFRIKELDSNYSNLIEKSVGGFGSHEEFYDVAIIFDKELGLYAIPFFETFTKIFEGSFDIENAKECVEYFLDNDSIPDKILNIVHEKYENFMDKINELLNTSYSYDELIKKYKSSFTDNKIYSSATVLYASNAFSNMFENISKPKPQQPILEQKVGRNEPCPCGSGKKYKNCCGLNK